MSSKPETKTETHMLRVTLNGTTMNPFHRLGLRQNPFPQIAKAEVDRLCLHLQVLEGDPIPNIDYIRKHLKGWSDEFVQICCHKFTPGEMVTFYVAWKGPLHGQVNPDL